jgi:hypothetical protein
VDNSERLDALEYADAGFFRSNAAFRTHSEDPEACFATALTHWIEHLGNKRLLRSTPMILF